METDVPIADEVVRLRRLLAQAECDRDTATHETRAVRAAKNARIQELLEANNRYLEEGQAARAALRLAEDEVRVWREAAFADQIAGSSGGTDPSARIVLLIRAHVPPRPNVGDVPTAAKAVAYDAVRRVLYPEGRAGG